MDKLFTGISMLREYGQSTHLRNQRTSETPISFLDLAFGFLPAFRDMLTGRTHLATNPDGSIANMHILDHLPMEWADEVDSSGQIISLRDGIMAGFVRGSSFFTLDDLRNAIQDA
jgi:hypothetical protein